MLNLFSRSISIRIPLLIYGANIAFNEDITIENLTELVDDVSWQEFMPKGVTKDLFKEFIKYYDKEVFIVAGLKIRDCKKCRQFTYFRKNKRDNKIIFIF